MEAERYMMFVYMSANMFNCLMILMGCIAGLADFAHLYSLPFSLFPSLFPFSFLVSSNILHILKTPSTTYEYLAHIVTHL